MISRALRYSVIASAASFLVGMPAAALAVTTTFTKNINNDESNRPFFDPAGYDPQVITNGNDYAGTATSGVHSTTTVTGTNIGIGGDGTNGVPMGVSLNFDVSFAVTSTNANSVLVDGLNPGLGVQTTGETGGALTQISVNDQLLFNNFQVTNVSFYDPLGLLQPGATISNPKWFLMRASNFAMGDQARTSDDAAVTSGVTLFNSSYPIANNFTDALFPAKEPFYVTGVNGNWNLKGLSYQLDFTHDLAAAPAARRTFQFSGANLPAPNATSYQLADGDATVTLNAVGAGGVFVTNNLNIGIGVNSTEDDVTGGDAAQRGIDGTLATPESVQFSFDKKVSLESITVDGIGFTRENFVLSFVSGVNPFTGLTGYAGDYAVDANSVTVSETAEDARQPFPLMFGVDGQDEIIVEAGTVLAITSSLKPAQVSDGGFLVTMITANVVDDVVIDADFDNDDDVDGNDFLIWQRNVGTGTTNTQGNADGDSDVDGDDLLEWEGAFGSATANTAPVPEPATLALAAMGALAVTGLHSRRSARSRRGNR